MYVLIHILGKCPQFIAVSFTKIYLNTFIWNKFCINVFFVCSWAAIYLVRHCDFAK